MGMVDKLYVGEMNAKAAILQSIAVDFRALFISITSPKEHYLVPFHIGTFVISAINPASLIALSLFVYAIT